MGVTDIAAPLLAYGVTATPLTKRHGERRGRLNFVDDSYDFLDEYDIEVGTFGFLLDDGAVTRSGPTTRGRSRLTPSSSAA